MSVCELVNSPSYVSWYGMKTRCLNSNCLYYDNYGGRGVKICDDWLIFKNFYRDMGDRPKGMTLERIDVNGNYEPSNCKWASRVDQNRNQRIRKDNRSGFRGVGYNKKSSKWRARINVNGKSVNLGYFKEIDDAIIAREEAEKKYWK